MLCVALAPFVGCENDASAPSDPAPVVTLGTAYAQTEIAYLTGFPRLPAPFVVRDWKATAKAYDAWAFDETLTGPHLPLVTFDGPTFSLPSYLGSPDGGEALAVLGAVLGGSLAGVDKTAVPGQRDWVAMAQAYYHTVDGHGQVFNGLDSEGAGSYWYDMMPACLFFGIAAHYPERDATLVPALRGIADSWRAALPSLVHNWEHAGFLFTTMQTVDEDWVEPDAATGIAYLEYLAFAKTGDPAYLDAAKQAMGELESRQTNPMYEVLGYYGPLVAARMNAEQGTEYALAKHLDWVFAATSAARPTWGVIKDRWGNYDAYGLTGSTDDFGGYAFAMNTFVAAGMVAPVARYAPRYAHAIGKWLLHLSANANLFYPDTLPANMQSPKASAWFQETGLLLSFEGVKKQGKTTPYATGDAPVSAANPTTDLTPYGAWGAGYLAALVDKTNVPEVLRFNMLATDAFHPPAHPTWLYYNPREDAVQVEVDVGPTPRDVLEIVSGVYVARSASGKVVLHLAADTAALIVVVPAGGKLTRDGRKTLIDGVVVDWNRPG
jgi:hypothetical protein